MNILKKLILGISVLLSCHIIAFSQVIPCNLNPDQPVDCDTVTISPTLTMQLQDDLECFDPIAPIALEIVVSNFDAVSALDFVLTFDPNEYSYASTSLGELTGYTVDDTDAALGRIRWFWNSPDGSGVCLEDGSLLSNFRFSNEFSCTSMDFDLDMSVSFATINYNNDGIVCDRPIDFQAPPIGACLQCNNVNASNILDLKPMLSINGPDTVEEGDLAVFEFTMADFISVSSIQFTLTFNPQVLEYVDLKNAFLPGATGALVPNELQIDNGILGLVWFDQNAAGICADPDEVLFRLCFNVTGKTGTSSVLDISDVLTDIEVGLSLATSLPSCPISDLCMEPDTVNVNCDDLFFCWSACSASDVDGMGGSITVIPCGGTGPYKIFVGSTFVGNVEAGEAVEFDNLNGSNTNYTVRVCDASGDVIEELVVLGDAPSIMADLNVTQPSCNNTSNGCIHVNDITGGVPFSDGSYLLEWSTGVFTVDSICGLSVGEYCLMVTDSVGCVQTFCEILETPALDFMYEVTQMPSCEMSGMAGDGEIKLTPTGGTPPYFLGSSNIPMDCFVIDGLQPGDQNFLIEDSNGCLLDVEIELEADLEFDFVIKEFVNACDGNGMFSVQVLIPGQTNVNVAVQVFGINTGQLDCGVLGGECVICPDAPADTYTVVASDFMTGCTGTTQITVEEFPPLTISSEVEQAGCDGMSGKITITDVQGAIDDIQYQWSVSGETGNSICDLSNGTYTVTVSDGRCQHVEEFILDEPGGDAMVTAICSPVECDGMGNGGALDAAVTGGSGGGVTYEWFNLQGDVLISNMQMVTNVMPGTYYVIATDASGTCSVSDTCTIDNPDNLIIEESSQTSPLCADSNDGVICLDVVMGDNVPLSFSWAGPDGYTSLDSAKVTDAPCGMYSITVTDVTGCSSVLDVNLICPPEIEVEITIIEPVICDSLNSGKALAIASGGTTANGEYSFTWSSGSMNMGDIGTGIGFTEGTQWVIACDDNNCCSEMVEFEVPGLIPITLSSLTTITDVSCFGLADGQATVVAEGGDEPYEYLWFDGEMGDTHTDLPTGWYHITVTDFDGCILEDSIFIDEPELLMAEIDLDNTNDIACASEESGRITVDVTGGTPPFDYMWTNNVSTQNVATGLTEGTYCITVTDANGCMDEVCHTIETADPVFATLNVPEVPDCFGGASCISVATFGGGIGNNYTFSVNFGNPIAIDSCLEVFAGEYTINVFDSTGCAFETMVEVFQPNPVEVDLGPDITIQLGDTLTQLTADIISDLPIDTILWSEPVECINDDLCDQAIISPTSPTVYSVTVTDTNGCIGIDDVFVNIEDVRNVFAANIFSPNGDGRNDEFRILIGQGVEEVEEFLIYNRWGNLVFESSGNADALGSEAWDGRFNGQRVEPGVFVYYARVSFIDDTEIEYKGSVTVIR